MFSGPAVDVAALLPPASADRVIPVLCLAGEHQIAPTRCAERHRCRCQPADRLGVRTAASA